MKKPRIFDSGYSAEWAKEEDILKVASLQEDLRPDDLYDEQQSIEAMREAVRYWINLTHTLRAGLTEIGMMADRGRGTTCRLIADKAEQILKETNDVAN